MRRQRRDFNVRPAHTIEMPLRRTEVLRSRGSPQTEPLIEGYAAGAVDNADRRMIDAEKEFAPRPDPPMRRYLVRRKGQQFQRMPIGIAKLEGGDAA